MYASDVPRLKRSSFTFQKKGQTSGLHLISPRFPRKAASGPVPPSQSAPTQRLEAKRGSPRPLLPLPFVCALSSSPLVSQTSALCRCSVIACNSIASWFPGHSPLLLRLIKFPVSFSSVFPLALLACLEPEGAEVAESLGMDGGRVRR